MESDDSTYDWLNRQIFRSLVWSPFDAGKPFLPHDSIGVLITKDVIRKVLTSDDGSKAPEGELVDWIHRTAAKIFAITIQCDIGWDKTLKSMRSFQQLEFNDESLSIDDPRSTSDQEQPQPFLDRCWNPQRRYRFWEYQWRCLSPVFAADQYDYDLSSECILPFIWKDERVRVGAFSSVYRVKIHPAHQEHELKDVRAQY